MLTLPAGGRRSRQGRTLLPLVDSLATNNHYLPAPSALGFGSGCPPDVSFLFFGYWQPRGSTHHTRSLIPKLPCPSLDAMDFSGCLNDGENVLDPVVKGCRGDFDFTIQFETIFFSLIPNRSVPWLQIPRRDNADFSLSSLIICLSLPRLLLLYRRPSIVGGVILRTSKLVRFPVLVQHFRNFNDRD